MHPKKIYKNIDSVPLDEWNPIILALKQGEQAAAEKLYRNVLDSIKEVKGYEVIMLTRKLREEAGI